MKIVLDTNIFFGDFLMRSTYFNVLINHLNLLPATLAIPEIVIDETVNKYREVLTESLHERSGLDRKINSLLLGSPSDRYHHLNIDSVEQRYRSHLESSIRQVGDIIPYPKTDHKQIVLRELLRKKPFKSNGSGYRDMLVWKSVTSLMYRGVEQVIFVTNNTTDFGKGPRIDTDFHDDFVNPDRLIVLQSLRQLNDQYIFPRLQKHKNEILDIINFDLTEWLRNNLIKTLWDYDDLGPVIVNFPHEVGSIRALNIQIFNDISIIQQVELEGSSQFLKFKVDADLMFDIDMDAEDYYHHEEVREFLGHSGLSGSASVEIVENLIVTFDCVLEKDRSDFTSIEVVSFESNYGIVEY